MNKLLLVTLFAIVASAMAGSFAQDQFLFEKFQSFHGKQYRVDEVDLRFNIFRDNLKVIEAHNEKYNRGESTFHLGLTKFADLTNAEYKRTVLGAYRPFPSEIPASMHVNTNTPLPESVDWRQKGVVTEVKNQGQCGSCWSFSACGSMEGAHALAAGSLINLSEQQLVDCVNGGANTCSVGGWMTDAFSYAIKYGMESESEYPYWGSSGNSCKYAPNKVVAHFTGYKNVTVGSETDLQDSVANFPTVSVAIDASSMMFQLYSGGVYDDSTCKNGLDDLDHGVLTVGYGALDGKDYWIVKNSWGPDWGLSGYILMSRNKDNQCGIATAASFPLTS